MWSLIIYHRTRTIPRLKVVRHFFKKSIPVDKYPRMVTFTHALCPPLLTLKKLSHFFGQYACARPCMGHSIQSALTTKYAYAHLCYQGLGRYGWRSRSCWISRVWQTLRLASSRLMHLNNMDI